MQARLKPETEEEIRRCHEMGITDVNQVLTITLSPFTTPIFVLDEPGLIVNTVNSFINDILLFYFPAITASNATLL